MPHIEVPEGLPGILGPMAISSESTKVLGELAEASHARQRHSDGGARTLLA
jgi:hypothetical protein